MRNQVNRFALIAVLLAAACALGRNAFAQEATLTEKAQQSIVYISFDVTDPKTGAKVPVQGTGFIVSKSGYVLTASHLFRDWEKQTDVDKRQNLIRGSLRDKPGFVPESPQILRIVRSAESEDIALLVLPSAIRDYAAASVCIREASAAKVGDNFVAFGFPQDQNFQPVQGILGTTNALGGRWAAAAPFTYGMSGGPVYNTRGFVIGLIKGGLETDAVRWITPVEHALNLLQTARGYVENCGSPVSDLCGSRNKTSPEKQTASDGKKYLVHYDFTRGQERIEPKACGRQIWTLEDENDPWFLLKYVYLVDGKKRYTSQNLYTQKDDGTLEIVEQQSALGEPAATQPVTDLCGSGIKTSPEKQTGSDGKKYLVQYDFTRGQERIEPKACGRQIWTLEDENDPWFGWKFVQFVDGKKRFTSQDLYIEKDDGSLERSKR